MLDQIRAFFAAFFGINAQIVTFVHAQVFFILGVVMLLQWRQKSRLELAVGLPWLAAFGLLEAVAVWGDVFIPVQAGLLEAGAITSLRLLQLLVWACAFSAMLGYGLHLIEPKVLRPATVLVPIGAAVFFGAMLLLMGGFAGRANQVWLSSMDAFMRYTLCLPAALLAAFGLRRRAGRLLGPLRQENIIADLRVAGFGFVFYAVAEGVIVPAAPFFPANVINVEALFRATGIPIGIVRALAGAIILVFFFRALEVFRIEVERIKQSLEQQGSLNAERERISRDLHDGTLQTIYASGLLLDGARQSLRAARQNGHADPAGLDHADEQLGSAMDTLNHTVDGIRSTIFDLRAVSPDQDLARGLIEIVSEFRLRTGLRTEWRMEGQPRALSSLDQQQNVYHIAREALSNVARHAHATRVEVCLAYLPRAADAGLVRLTISDNGTGQIPSAGRVGRGLQNMRERAAMSGAALTVVGEQGRGSTVTLELR